MNPARVRRAVSWFRSTFVGRTVEDRVKRAIAPPECIPEITPLSPRPSDLGSLRWNLLVPSINQQHLFGGIATAIQFFNSLRSEDVDARIILTDSAPGPDDLSNFSQWKFSEMKETDGPGQKIIPINDRYGRTLAVGPRDVFVATAWWTAFLAKRLRAWQIQQYGLAAPPIVYLIQDFEPAFYQWSSRYVLALSTYQNSEDMIGVFNTSLLHAYFESVGITFQKRFIFEPRMGETLRKALAEYRNTPKKRLLIFYGRPSVARNGFEFIAEALKLWAVHYPNAKNWTVLSLGEAHGDLELGGGIVAQSRGKLTLTEYARVLSQAAVGISIMVSPHPSYPPLEMAHFGVLTLTNCFANKNLSTWHGNIESIAEFSPEALASAIGSQCDLYECDHFCGWRRESHFPVYESDVEQHLFCTELRTQIETAKVS